MMLQVFTRLISRKVMITAAKDSSCISSERIQLKLFEAYSYHNQDDCISKHLLFWVQCVILLATSLFVIWNVK